MTRTVNRTLPVVALLALGLSSCGDVGGEARAKPAVRTPDADTILVSCGVGPGWPVSAMGVTGPKGTFGDAMVRKELEGWGEAQGADLTAEPWFVLQESATSATVAVGDWTAEGPGEDGQAMDFEKVDGAWVSTSIVGCNLAPTTLAGHSWIAVEWAPDADRASKDLALQITGVECGLPPDPRPLLDEPVVVETEDTVTVSLTLTNPESGDSGTCVGYPSVPYTVTLDQPLGDRALLDGSVYPPGKVKVG